MGSSLWVGSSDHAMTSGCLPPNPHLLLQRSLKKESEAQETVGIYQNFEKKPGVSGDDVAGKAMPMPSKKAPPLPRQHGTLSPYTVERACRGGRSVGRDPAGQGHPLGLRAETRVGSGHVSAETGTYGKIWESSTKCSIDNFTFIKVLGKGSFGKVRAPWPRGRQPEPPEPRIPGTPASHPPCLLPGGVGPRTLDLVLALPRSAPLLHPSGAARRAEGQKGILRHQGSQERRGLDR